MSFAELIRKWPAWVFNRCWSSLWIALFQRFLRVQLDLRRGCENLSEKVAQRSGVAIKRNDLAKGTQGNVGYAVFPERDTFAEFRATFPREILSLTFPFTLFRSPTHRHANVHAPGTDARRAANMRFVSAYARTS